MDDRPYKTAMTMLHQLHVQGANIIGADLDGKILERDIWEDLRKL